jgi:hypothetical protein
MTNKLTLWAVYTNDDLTEGRGREFIKHFCATQATAFRLAKGKYVQGTDCPVKQVEVMCIEGNYFLPISMITIIQPSSADDRQQILLDEKKAALKKAKCLGLTDEEIAALGKTL